MDVNHFFLHNITHGEQVLRRALSELSTEELNSHPCGPGTNSIAWLIWHLTRIQDLSASARMGKDQAWVAEGFHAKFGMEADFMKFNSFTPEELDAFPQMDAESLLGYYECARGYLTEYVNSLSASDLDAPVPPRPHGPENVGDALGITLADNTQHFGQIAFIMGVVKGFGWYGR